MCIIQKKLPSEHEEFKDMFEAEKASLSPNVPCTEASLRNKNITSGHRNAF